MLAIITVLVLPPRESWRRRVNLLNKKHKKREVEGGGGENETRKRERRTMSQTEGEGGMGAVK